VVKRYRAKPIAARRTYRLRLSPRRLRRGDYRVTVKAGRSAKTLTSRRL
jgi:hypothetical protein